LGESRRGVFHSLLAAPFAMAMDEKGKQVAAGSSGKRRKASADAGAGPSSSSAAERRHHARVEAGAESRMRATEAGVPMAAGSSEIGMGVSSREWRLGWGLVMEDWVCRWEREVLGHGSFSCAPPNPPYASCFGFHLLESV
jgi:hypothetical protein